MAKARKALDVSELEPHEHTVMTIIKSDGVEEYHVEDFVIIGSGRMYRITSKVGATGPELEGLFTDKDKARKAVIRFLERVKKNEKDDYNVSNQ